MVRESCGGKDRCWHEAGGMRDSTVQGSSGKEGQTAAPEGGAGAGPDNLRGKASRQTSRDE